MLLFLAALAHQPPKEAPSAFLKRLYAEYRNPDFSPFKHPSNYFAPALTAAIREDERLAKGEVGYLDGDPLCDCQDYDRISLKIDSIRATSVRADAKVRVDLDHNDVRKLRLSLQLTRSGWRVADVIGAGGNSLLHELQQSNARQRRH